MSNAAEAPETPTQAVSIQLAPSSGLEKIIAMLPRALSSHAHIIFLGCLGMYLVLLPLLGVNVSARQS